ncbi:MAG: hypothetical protein HYX92_12830 [Chloroflexi bacterium]|nr:hypothetical protein [Chloroflexota bacterium]
MSRPRRASGLWKWLPVVAVLAIFFIGYLSQGQSAGVAPAPKVVPPAPKVVAPAPAAPAGPPPSATFDVDSVDLGTVPVGQVVSYTFRIGNAGPGPLVIQGAWSKVLEGC